MQHDSHATLPAVERLTVLLARKTFDSSAMEVINDVLRDQIDWYAFLAACIRNKILPLAWWNLKQLGLAGSAPEKIAEVCEFYALGTAKKNSLLLEQFELVKRALSARGVTFAPLKGLVLINDVYSIDSRQLSDLDLMVTKESTALVRDVMNSIGYFESEYNRTENTLMPLSRRKKLLWGLYMYNLPVFMKLLDAQHLAVAEVDFTFDIRFDSKRPASVEFLSRMRQNIALGCDALREEEFLLHLCCHLYKEATNLLWVEREADFNLIKFCDVREYMLKIHSTLDIGRLLELSNRYAVQSAVQFTFYYLSKIYADGYESTILQQLPTLDETALRSFGERDIGRNVVIEGTFWRRFFKSDYLPTEKERSKYSSLM